MEANVTVMGYGAVGRETVKLLADRGDKVRVAQRSHPRGLRLEAEFVPTDVLNPESVLNACTGSEAVICCLGFPYDSRIWQKSWPKAMANLLSACEKAKARFIFADNLYMYGPQTAPSDRGHAAHRVRPQAQVARGDYKAVAGGARPRPRASCRGSRFRFLWPGCSDIGPVGVWREKPAGGEGGHRALSRGLSA